MTAAPEAAPVVDAPKVEASAAAPTTLDRVEIKDTAASDRRVANAVKVQVSREDFMRLGANTLADALQRISGVTVVREPGKEAELRLRGLGNGYTQILVNGDPAPPGFSIESLAPDLVERVEILRSATADTGAQAIAGTINIILRKARAGAPLQLRLSAGPTAGLMNGQASLDWSQASGAWKWGLGASLAGGRNAWHAASAIDGFAPEQTYRYALATEEREEKYIAGLTPNLGWKSASGDSLSLAGLLQATRNVYANDDARTRLSGDAPEFASDSLDSTDRARLARWTAQWKGALSPESRLDVKLTLSSNSRDLDALFVGRDAQAAPRLTRTVASHMRDDANTLSGKYALDLGDDHTLGLGWDLQAGKRSERRVQDETGTEGYPSLDLDEDYSAHITRAAIFAQHEWTIDKQMSAYAGLRWEGLRTRTEGAALDPVTVSASVFSPVGQLIWKLPGSRSDQLRIALGRTYKAPTPRQLVPRRWVVSQNSPTSPDFRGNPALHPELAWSLDLAFERYLAHDGLLGLSGYARDIHGVVLQRIHQEDQTWIQSPVNAGRALVLGLEGELKGPLRDWLQGAPDMDLRLGATRNWSRVHDVPGPGNRLGSQPSATLTLGADWRASKALTLGSSFVYERGGYVRTSLAQSTSRGSNRLLDLYAAWRLNPSTKFRVAATNVLARPYRSWTQYMGEGFGETMQTTLSNPASLRVQLEMTL
ncbi:TonB-dependent receptor plug domain-containing protein [Roseateles sp. BYS96W]|uniref:TonB-dependent receptor plug domain-containing protein n=1 Tax=Pelomonas nitida TaxID=3299027 RepID=A0ABW7GCM6_9BURK